MNFLKFIRKPTKEQVEKPEKLHKLPNKSLYLLYYRLENYFDTNLS